MALCGVYIAVTEYLSDDVNVVSLIIKARAECAAQLMRRDIFERSDDRGILFNQILHSAHGDPAFLQRKKQCRVAFDEFLTFALVQIVTQCGDYLIGEI